MTTEEIMAYSQDQLFNRDNLLAVFEEESEMDRFFLLEAFIDKSEEFKCKGKMKSLISAVKKDLDREIKAQKRAANNQTEFGHPAGELLCGSWIADKTGIKILTIFGDKLACYHPILPIERLFNIETKTEKVTLAYFRDNSWKEITVDKAIIASASKIVKLADYGISVTSETAKTLVQYLSDVENLNVIPVKNSTSKFGWHGTDFIPFDNSVVFDDESRFRELSKSLVPRGSYEMWLDLVKEIRKNTTHYEPQVYMSACFASVLVSKLNMLPFIVNLWGSTGKGKAQPLDTKIITPTGYKLMGDMAIGDYVIGGDGKSHKIIGVYPQGKKDVYEITFKDGRKTRCCKEHLWNVYSHSHGEWKLKTRELQDIMQHPLKTSYGYNFRIPLCEPVNYSPEKELPISPYLLGALIGDGCLTLKKNQANRSESLYFSNSEDDVIQRVKQELKAMGAYLGKESKYGNQYEIYGSATLKSYIKELGLNTYSAKRFIPDEYKLASVKDRELLLAGLIDTDGNVSGNRITYSTLSYQLANDVLHIARSLGYKASVKNSVRPRTGKAEYTVSISTNDFIFSSKKHTEKYSNHSRNRSENKNVLAIVDIQKVGYEECQCLMIDSEEHTYLCDDFIVTHNTVALMMACSIFADPSEGKYITDSYATQNAFEIRLDILNHLPLLMDDMSKVRDKMNNDFTDLIYLLCSGKGKDRSNVDLGLNKMKCWQNTILSNMERPLATETMKGGAINRILDFEMVDGYIFQDGNRVVEILKDNYGWAGLKYVDFIKELPVEAINAIRKDFERKIKEEAKKQNSEKEEKQILPMSLLLTADKIATDYIFEDGIYLDIPTMVSQLKDVNEVSEGLRAYETIMDYAEIYAAKFSSDNQFKPESWGFVKDGYIHIIPTTFKNIAKNENFSVKAFCTWAKQKKLLEANNKNQNIVRIGDKTCRFYSIKMGYNKENAENADEFRDANGFDELPFD